MSSGQRGIFISILVVVFSLLCVYTSHQLIRFADFSTIETVLILLLVFVPTILAVALPIIFWNSDRAIKDPTEVDKSPFLNWLQFFSHISICFINYLFFTILIRDIVGFVDSIFHWDIVNYDRAETILVFQLVIMFLLVGLIPIVIGPRVKKVSLKIPVRPGTTKPSRVLRLVQASDIHIGDLFSFMRVEQISKKLNELKADAILLTGDILDGDVVRYQKALDQIGRASSKYGTFFVSGNHEYYWNIKSTMSAIQKTPIKPLFNQTEKFQFEGKTISISGTPDPAARYFDQETPNFSLVNQQAQGSDYKIILVHQPHLADEVAKYDFDLQLSGHTHAGQFLPWSLLIGFFQKYAKGLYEIPFKNKSPGREAMKLYVNQGTGFWGPPNRLGTYCELTLIEIEWI